MSKIVYLDVPYEDYKEARSLKVYWIPKLRKSWCFEKNVHLDRILKNWGNDDQIAKYSFLLNKRAAEQKITRFFPNKKQCCRYDN